MLTRSEFDEFVYAIRTGATLEDAGAAAASIWFDLDYAQKAVKEACESVEYHRTCTADVEEARRLDAWLERNKWAR